MHAHRLCILYNYTATGSCRALKEPAWAWKVINTISFIFIDSCFSHEDQHLLGLSPGMPWPAATNVYSTFFKLLSI